jgi:hypothetical protein
VVTVLEKLTLTKLTDGEEYILYNNIPSNAIVNAVSDITYRPLIEAAVLNI